VKQWHCVFTTGCVTLAGVQAWQSRYAMNSDGVSYLEIAGNWAAGEWRTAVSAIWPPLYSWILGAGLALLRPAPAWELPVARLVNFAIFLAALAAFRFFLRRYLEAWRKTAPGGAMPEGTVVIFGYVLFAFTSLHMITVRQLVPDLCAAAAVYIAAGLILKIWTGDTRGRTYALLGLVLGLGYLARTSLQPLGLVFVLAAILAARPAAALRQAGLALGVFLAVVGGWLATASWANGRLVVNENAKINYAWHVNGVSRRFWEGGAHAPRKLVDSPLLLEFEVPRPVTHPLHYDPSYWYQGIQPYFDWEQQRAAIVRSVKVLRQVFSGGWQITLFVAAGLAIALGGSLGTLWGAAPLLLPALASFVMYSLVHVEPRYLAPFVTLLWMGVVFGVRLEAGHAEAWGAAVVITAVLSAPPLVLAALPGAPERYWRAASQLRQAGVRGGEKVGLIGLPSADVMWARLARVRVVAHIPGEFAEEYWRATPERRGEIRQVFAGTGARALLASRTQTPPPDQAWRPVAGTPFWYLLLP
jgi:hypothetical protein